MIKTYNSKFDKYGNRLNLVINEGRKELYFKSCNAWNLGDIIEDLGIREVNSMYKSFLKQGYAEVRHSDVKNWNREA